MSQFIVQCLNPYRKPDCKLGRITNTEDFKHLARKVSTHVNIIRVVALHKAGKVLTLSWPLLGQHTALRLMHKN